MLLKVFILSSILLVSVLAFQNKYCQLSCDYVVKTFSHTVCNRQNSKCGPDPRCGPDFKILKMSDNHRQYIVDLHNYFRNLVAIGAETRGNQPPATNMNAINYNKELEFIAQCWANTCNGNPLNHDNCRRTVQFEHVGQNLGFINTTSTEIELHTAIKDLILLWYNEVAIYPSEWVKHTQDRGPRYKVGHYTQMLWADTTDIGCALSYYTTGGGKWNHVIFVCNYGPGGNYLGAPVYKIGEPATECANNLKGNQEFYGLCGNTRKVSQDRKSFNNVFGFGF